MIYPLSLSDFWANSQIVFLKVFIFIRIIDNFASPINKTVPVIRLNIKEVIQDLIFQ
ncbi:hypothetical protein LEP1GSC086_0417 [Leptospira weilii str. LNT 1234]|nr:hypothetical protein LEP1GSC086_0417 [Leptospira weilii str. LNT 1234]